MGEAITISQERASLVVVGEIAVNTPCIAKRMRDGYSQLLSGSHTGILENAIRGHQR